MTRIFAGRTRLGVAIVSLCLLAAGCSTTATTKYWGQVEAPDDNVLRYITGSEPESLDPSFVTGQPEARILIGLFDRLVEYHPKTMQPIPSMATHWEVSDDGIDYTFHLRKNGKYSNGDPITAKDFEWSFKRALSPELASRYAFIGFEIKYAEQYNAKQSFAKKDGKFLNADENGEPLDSCDVDGPACLTLAADEESLAKIKKDNAELATRIEGAEFVEIKPDDIGVNATDDYTLEVTLKQPAPYFVGMLTHQFFAAVHRPTIEKHGKNWIKPENIVTSGAFKVEEWKPYDEMTIVRDPNYWDAKNVKLDAVKFYPMDEQTTMMNIYKAGRVDALYNHTVPAAWNEFIRQFKDEYLLHPEVTIEYYTFSVKKKPFDNLDVRKAFSLAVNRESLEVLRKTVKKSADFVPLGIFPEYEKARTKVFAELSEKDGITPEQMQKRLFDPTAACAHMKKAGYSVQMTGSDKCKVTDFPLDGVELSYNTAESNKQVAEFVQSQWQQNLGLTIPLKNMEFKTYLPYRSAIEYKGVARAGWVGDFMDPYTFLSQFYTEANDSSTGWWDPVYDKMLDDANKTLDPEKRYEKLAEAEYYVLKDQPVMPLSVAGTSWMKKPYVKGMYPNPGTMHPWKFVYIEKDRAKWDQNVDKIMTEQSDPAIDAEVAALMKSQLDFERANASKSEEGGEDEETDKTE
ncbi:MAG: peptide ABC transporter substrate-binding protein [Pyrinomonadaceae bacterium]|nr:peptide ABC transporter substrate-binding protein [Pyrinomonadaceae bacterium]